MNTPVTHSECLRCREDLEKQFHDCMKEERIGFKEAVADVEAWVLRLEDKIEKISNGLDNLVKTLLIGMILIFIEFVWGRL